MADTDSRISQNKTLPAGTVTFLFTDIEGSTQLLYRLGEEYATVLAEQRDILRTAFKNWDGHEIDTQGEGATYRALHRGLQMAYVAVVEEFFEVTAAVRITAALLLRSVAIGPRLVMDDSASHEN
jgi:class 3 adenylate cyclase